MKERRRRRLGWEEREWLDEERRIGGERKEQWRWQKRREVGRTAKLGEHDSERPSTITQD